MGDELHAVYASGYGEGNANSSFALLSSMTLVRAANVGGESSVGDAGIRGAEGVVADSVAGSEECCRGAPVRIWTSCRKPRGCT